MEGVAGVTLRRVLPGGTKFLPADVTMTWENSRNIRRRG